MKLPITFGGFTSKEEYKKMPFWLLREDADILISHRNMLLDILEYKTGSTRYSAIFIQAFEYFMLNPTEYDGTSGGEELDIITVNGVRYRYDISAIIHDFLDAFGFTFNLFMMKCSDKLLVKMTEELHSCSFNISKRRVVSIMARYRVWKNRNKKKPFYDIELRNNVIELVKDYNINYNSVIKHTVYALLVLTALISKYGFKYIVNIFLSLF